MSDFCPTKELNGAYVQENKLIRNHKGYLIGRLTDTVAYESEHIVSEKVTVKQAMDTLKQSMIDDGPGELGSYAHGWHCNIAMMCADAIHADSEALTWEDAHRIGNDAASRFMKLCFDVDTTNELNKG